MSVKGVEGKAWAQVRRGRCGISVAWGDYDASVPRALPAHTAAAAGSYESL